MVRRSFFRSCAFLNSYVTASSGDPFVPFPQLVLKGFLNEKVFSSVVRFSHGIDYVLVSEPQGGNVYVTNWTTGTIGEYTTSGGTVNATLISGLSNPDGVAVSGSDLFVVNPGNGTIGEYTTSGATVNPSLVSGLYGVTFACSVRIEPVRPQIGPAARLENTPRRVEP